MVTIPGDAHTHQRGRLLSFLPGSTLVSVSQPPELLYSVGVFLGRFSNAMQKFPTQGTERQSEWNPSSALDTLRTFSSAVSQCFPIESTDNASITAESAAKSSNLPFDIATTLLALPPAATRISIITRIVADYTEALSAAGSLPQCVIHCDANEMNIIISSDYTDSCAHSASCTDADATVHAGTSTATGATASTADLSQYVSLIDFGDVMLSSRVFELANCIGYLMLYKDDPLSTAVQIAAGYLSTSTLSPSERGLIIPAALARIAVSVTMSAHSFKQNPENAYVLTTARPGWRLLQQAEAMGGLVGMQRLFEQALDRALKEKEE
jgi:Ser/Thr protein kinase RdoA (MazF antagonist)